MDIYAACLTSIASAHSSGFALYHLGNSHWDDGISLDRIADWVASSGYRLSRLATHGEWYAAFKAALEALDVKKKQQSPLPTVYQWEQPITGSGELSRSVPFAPACHAPAVLHVIGRAPLHARDCAHHLWRSASMRAGSAEGSTG